MKVIKVFGVDLGTLFVKTSNDDTFSSGVSTELTTLGGNTLKVDGVTYRMGIPGALADYDVNLNKSKNGNIRACYIYALLKDQQHEGIVCYDEVRTALPFTQWENQETLDDFKNLLDLSKGASVEINGKRLQLVVSKLKVAPEGYTAYELLDHSIIQGKRTLLVDIGSRTINTLLFEDDECIMGHTEIKGVLQTLNKMSGTIQTVSGRYIPAEDIPLAIRDLDGIQEIIEKDAQDAVSALMKRLKSGYAFDSIKNIVFIGGGALLLKNAIEQLVPGAIIPADAQTITAKGLTL